MNEPRPQFEAGEAVRYAIGQTRKGKDILVKAVFTYLRPAGVREDADGVPGRRVVLKHPADDPLYPNEEWEVWEARLRKVQ